MVMHVLVRMLLMHIMMQIMFMFMRMLRMRLLVMSLLMRMLLVWILVRMLLMRVLLVLQLLPVRHLFRMMHIMRMLVWMMHIVRVLLVRMHLVRVRHRLAQDAVVSPHTSFIYPVHHNGVRVVSVMLEVRGPVQVVLLSPLRLLVRAHVVRMNMRMNIMMRVMPPRAKDPTHYLPQHRQSEVCPYHQHARQKS